MISDSSSSSDNSDSDSDYEIILSRGKRFEERITIDYYDDAEIITRFRISKSLILSLSQLSKVKLEAIDDRGYPLDVTQQLLIPLRYYATGSFQIVVGDMSGVHQSTAGRIIHKVSKAIASLSKQFIKMPSSEDEIREAKTSFYHISGLPNCIGAIDCSHMLIKSPGGNNAELYRNRKGYFSINTQAICDAHCRIIEITARWFGSAHDQTIFIQIKNRLENAEFGESFIIGDGGYGCKKYLLTPFRNPLPGSQSRYNSAFNRTRVKIENCFGIWKRRFSILSIESQVNVDNYLSIIIATAVLHNIAIENHEVLPPLDPIINAQISLNLIVPNIPVNQNESQNNEQRRNEIVTHYF